MSPARPGVALAVAVVLTGCGSAGDRARRSADTYVAAVNAIERRLAVPLAEISREGRAFARKQGSATATAARLDRAARRVETLRRQLAALPPPPGAGQLRRHLLRVTSLQASLAREVAALVSFLPAYAHALVPLRPLGVTLRGALVTRGPPRSKAEVLDRYVLGIGRILASLDRLHPPAVTRPLAAAETRSLRAVRSAATALAHALRSGSAKRLPTLLHRLDVAAVATESLAAQRAERAAISGYDARIVLLDREYASVAQAQQKLAATH